MSKYLYAEDTTPTNAAQVSADSGEIVHVHCANAAERETYACSLCDLLDDSDRFGGGAGEVEIVGDLNTGSVRVHLSLP